MHVGPLLYFFSTVFIEQFCFCITCVLVFLGTCGYCRLSLILNAGSSECPGSIEGNFFNDCKLHWVFNNYCQHSIYQRTGKLCKYEIYLYPACHWPCAWPGCFAEKRQADREIVLIKISYTFILPVPSLVSTT